MCNENSPLRRMPTLKEYYWILNITLEQRMLRILQGSLIYIQEQFSLTDSILHK